MYGVAEVKNMFVDMTLVWGQSSTSRVDVFQGAVFAGEHDSMVYSLPGKIQITTNAMQYRKKIL